ncbi:MAG TPA: APC family permease [Actinoplanes sp.]|jgi:amino acid transporter|nr:APC family permease [Actinoplanes sp.]
MTVSAALERKTMTTSGMFTFSAAASAPVVVLLGSIPATYATTNVVGVPLGFLLVGAVVALLSVGYTALSRHVPHPAVYYAVIARGLGRPSGVAGGMVGLLAYNGIQTSLYGLLGATLTDMFGGPWWLWALLAVALVGVVGVRSVAISTRLLATILVLSFIVLLMFDLAAVAHPADGSLSADGFKVAELAKSGVGGAAAYCLAALMGFEAAASFSEEARARVAPGRAVFISLGVLVGAYAVSAWAMGIAVGPQKVTTVAADPAVGLPFNVFSDQYGPLMPPLVRAMLVAAIITSLLALHSIAARYGFAMAREGVLPHALATTGRGRQAGSPVGGSLLQTGIALLVVLAFAVAGADPIATLFAWFSTLGALGLLALLVVTSLAAMAYLPKRGAEAENVWRRRIAPGLGVLTGALVLGTMVVNVDSMLGVGPDSKLPYVIPAVVVVVGLAGIIWALYLRGARPEVYSKISRGQPRRHAVVDVQLADIEL